MKNSVQIAGYVLLQHLLFVIGTVTINFNSIGYIGESIVLQCTDTAAITATSADWYRGGTQLDISLSRYSQTTTATGFNLTIFPVVSGDGGVYHCGIDFGLSSTKTLTIYYNTKDVSITGTDPPKGIKITIIAFPDPVYTVSVSQDGNLIAVNWTISKTTQTSGAIEVSLQNSSFLSEVPNKIYTVVVSITSPVALIVMKNITLVFPTTTTIATTTAVGPNLTTSSTNATDTNQTKTENDTFIIIISTSVSGGGAVLGVSIIVISYRSWRRKKKLRSIVIYKPDNVPDTALVDDSRNDQNEIKKLNKVTSEAKA